MNIGYFTDTHARFDTPVGRSDNFSKSLLQKLEEIGDIWKQNNVNVVLFGGDLFHTPDPAYSIVREVIARLRSWQLPIIAVIGSHDHFGYQAKTLKRTAVGLLESAGILDIVGSVGYKQRFSLPGNVDIVATPHTYSVCDDPANFLQFKESPTNFQIQLVHADLLDVPAPWKVVTCGEVRTESDLILSGHYHPGWPVPLVYGNTTFINPGSIGRLESTNVSRIPQVVIINSDTRKCNFIKLSHCEVHPFKVKVDDSREEHALIMQDVVKVISMLEQTTVDFVNTFEQLKLIAKHIGYGDNVLEKAYKFVEQVKETSFVQG